MGPVKPAVVPPTTASDHSRRPGSWARAAESVPHKSSQTIENLINGFDTMPLHLLHRLFMSGARFDPGGFYEFNLAEGAVKTRDGSRVLILSDNAVAPLVSTAVRTGDLTPIRQLGREIGEMVASSLGSPATECTVDRVLGHAASVLALFGWGRLGIQRWGDALVIGVTHAPTLDDDFLALAALLGGLFSVLARREVACVPTGSQGRFVVVDPTVAEQVWNWTREGADLSTVVGRLTPAEAAF